MEKKYFSEKEAADLVVKAAKLQEKAGGSDYTPGISFDELAKMASEAGIDPSFLSQAMQGVPTGDEEVRSFLGIPLSTEFERVVDVELPPENFDVVSEMFPPRFMGQGPHGARMTNVGQQVGRSLMMQLNQWPAFGQLKLTSRNGKTRITTKSTAFLAYFVGLHAPLILSFVLTMMMLPGERSANVNPAVLVPIIVCLMTAGMAAFTWISKAGQKKMRELTDLIAERVQEEGASLRANLESASEPIEERSDVKLEDRLS
ncbi:MAG: hypothetical protein ACKVQS_09910 [Fimbriimonadaceae bacterium]